MKNQKKKQKKIVFFDFGNEIRSQKRSPEDPVLMTGSLSKALTQSRGFIRKKGKANAFLNIIKFLYFRKILFSIYFLDIFFVKRKELRGCSPCDWVTRTQSQGRQLQRKRKISI